MWRIFVSSCDARELCPFYLKMIILSIFIFHGLICQSKCLEIGKGMKGANCKSNRDCDQSKYLQCIGTDSTCDCHYKVGEVWVREETSCMIKEGAPCERTTSVAKCITNSSCNSGVCECNDGFIRDGYSRCQLGYGQKCSEFADDCAWRYMLKCTMSERGNQFTCKCRNEGKDFVWDEDRQKCVRPAGGKCDLPGSSEYERDDRLECIENSECVDVGGRGVCQCKPTFAQTPDSTCMLQYGERCRSGDGPQCNRHQFLVCRDEKYCDCEFYGQMKYDNASKQCRVLAGESCDVMRKSADDLDTSVSHEKVPLCVPDSICKPKPGSQRGVCTCLPNMEKMSDGTCSRYNKGYGLPCSTNIDCDRRKFLQCVSDANYGSRCDCLQGDMYFDGTVCRVRVGRSCTENKICANNSYCEGDWCVCEKGYKVGNVDCIPEGGNYDARNLPTSEHTAKALSSITCSEFLQGSLEWTRCNCQANYASHIWINEKQSCLALVGINCSQDFECTPYAICDVHEKICQCSASALTSNNGTCIPRSGKSKQGVPDCTEVYTLKSVRSQEDDFYNSRANNVQSYLTCVAILVSYLV